MDPVQNIDDKSTILRKIPPKGIISKVIPVVFAIVIVAGGVFSGLVLASRSKVEAPSVSFEDEELAPDVRESFAQTFRDEAEGVIEKNEDFDQYSQGTHKLIRPGGEDQTAYLTSSVLDLDEYTGKNVKVFGETFGSSQVGWLMDVGKVEVQ